MSSSITSMSAAYNAYKAKNERIGATPRYRNFKEWQSSKAAAPYRAKFGTDPADAHAIPVVESGTDSSAILRALAEAGILPANVVERMVAPAAPELPTDVATKSSRTDGLPSLPKGFAFGKVYANGKGEKRCTLLIPAAQVERVAAAIRAL